MCFSAESLSHLSDTRSAIEQEKELQSEWKSIGAVPRDQVDSLWQRFRHACDRVFQNAREQRERKQEEWRANMQETLDRKRAQAEKLKESIAHDEANIERWKDTIYSLHEGGRSDEIRDSLESKISDVEDRISSKKDRLRYLEESIQEMERRL